MASWVCNPCFVQQPVCKDPSEPGPIDAVCKAERGCLGVLPSVGGRPQDAAPLHPFIHELSTGPAERAMSATIEVRVSGKGVARGDDVSFDDKTVARCTLCERDSDLVVSLSTDQY